MDILDKNKISLKSISERLNNHVNCDNCDWWNVDSVVLYRDCLKLSTSSGHPFYIDILEDVCVIKITAPIRVDQSVDRSKLLEFTQRLANDAANMACVVGVNGGFEIKSSVCYAHGLIFENFLVELSRFSRTLEYLINVGQEGGLFSSALLDSCYTNVADRQAVERARNAGGVSDIDTSVPHGTW